MSAVDTQNQYDKKDPTTQYARPKFEEQTQSAPGLAQEMNPKPDHGEKSYRGFGRLAGRKAVITGADSGIGRATAIAFAREGADIVLNYLPSETPDAAEVVTLIEDAGRKAHCVPGDVSDENFCLQLIERSVNALGGIDILVNVAGAQKAQEHIEELTTEQFDHTFKSNVYAMFWLCKAALAHMQPGAAIINTASIQAYQPSAFLLDYAPTKAAIVAFTKAWPSRSPGRESGSMLLLLVPYGHRFSPAVVNSRKSFPTLAPKFRWVGQVNPRSWLPSTYCWPRRSRAMLPARRMA